MTTGGNLLRNLPAAIADERIDALLTRGGVRIEHIISSGQASPPGFWYDQQEDEFVLLLEGEAGLLLEGEATPRTLRVGDWLTIPAHRRHRVEWTSANGPTVWLAVIVPAAPPG